MDVTITATASFSAGHRMHRGQPSRAHGHLWTIRVATLDPNDWTLEDDLRTLVAPFENESLEDMLTAGEPTMRGLALWSMERLLINHPKIVWVETSETPSVSVRVVREIRGPSK